METSDSTTWRDAHSNVLHWLHGLSNVCGTGLQEILESVFKGVENMLLVKSWPKALRGLRMVVEALLEPFVLSGNATKSSLEDILERARGSRCGRLWVDCLIKTVSIVLLYIIAEREGDWLLCAARRK